MTLPGVVTKRGGRTERILERRLPGERPADPFEYAAATRIEAQMLRYRFHDKLMKAFLGPEVFEGTVVVGPPASEQPRLAQESSESRSPLRHRVGN
jgi:hypothetical protein